jgi:hypothetical protein
MSLLTNTGELRVKLRGSTIPFGYESVEDTPGYVVPIISQLETLEEAKNYVRQGAFSYRDAASWLEATTGRKVSAQGLHKMIKKDSISE